MKVKDLVFFVSSSVVNQLVLRRYLYLANTKPLICQTLKPIQIISPVRESRKSSLINCVICTHEVLFLWILMPTR